MNRTVPLQEFKAVQDACERFRAGLLIIKEAGAANGGTWCAAQARGYLENLDFDMYPETGKPPERAT